MRGMGEEGGEVVRRGGRKDRSTRERKKNWPAAQRRLLFLLLHGQRRVYAAVSSRIQRSARRCDRHLLQPPPRVHLYS